MTAREVAVGKKKDSASYAALSGGDKAQQLCLLTAHMLSHSNQESAGRNDSPPANVSFRCKQQKRVDLT